MIKGKRAKTKLKLTIASFIVHCLIAIMFGINKVFDPMLWGIWFTSFNATLDAYILGKLKKDKLVFDHEEIMNGNADIH